MLASHYEYSIEITLYIALCKTCGRMIPESGGGERTNEQQLMEFYGSDKMKEKFINKQGKSFRTH